MKKILLIFGASGSLGSGVAKSIRDESYDKIYLFDREKIDDKNLRMKSVQTGDLSKEENVETSFSQVGLDSDAQYFLFSTIGGFAGGNEIADTSLDEWNKMMNLNLNISFLLAKHFINFCEKGKGGAICFTTAMTSLEPSQNKAAYGTSKSALNYLVKTLAKECKKRSISVNAISPLVLDTEENREWVKDESIMVKSEDIGKLVHSIFENRAILSGNIIELPGTLK